MTVHVVILGCGRSGTSIFGELFQHLPAYRYYFEPTFDAVKAIDFSAGPVAMKVPKLPLGSVMTPGLPILLDDLLAVVPEPRLIFWAVRHPLDTICSLRPGISQDWSHNPKPPDWQHFIDRPLLERCARHWQFINTAGFAAVRHIATVSRYETLVKNPRAFAANLCEQVGLDVDELRRVDEWAATVASANEGYQAKHQVRWSRPDHAQRVGRWRENLSSDEIEAVRPLLEPPARQFGYEWPV